MIREQKNKFWLTLILILSLSFSAFALGVANVFNNRKINSTLPVDATSSDYVEDKVAIDIDDKDNDGNRTEQLWVKNGSTFVSEIGTIYGGTEISVETASDLNTTANDESWHSALRVRVKGTDGTTPYENTYQPYIQNGYELVGFYFYANSTQYGDLFESGEKATTEQIDPEYTGNITIKAVCKPIEYELKMYVSKDGSTWEEEKVNFDVEEPTTLRNLPNIGTEGYERSFKNWAILTSYVDQNNGDFIVVDNINFGAINKDDKPAEADVFTAGDGKTYYYITSVQGYSSTKTNDWFTGTKHESNFNPAIRATWSYVYNGLISNDYIFHTLPNDVKEENVIGAVSSDDLNDADKNHKTAKLKIADSDNYVYRFMTNAGTAFYYKDEAVANKIESVNGSYYVYNYGYEITGWKVYFTFDGKNQYLKLDTAWKVQGIEENALNATTAARTDMKNVANEELNTTKLLARCLDAYFISGYDPDIKIFIEPQWQAANIKVNVDATKFKSGQSNTQISSTTYKSSYTISDTQVFTPAGQMIYAYETKDGNIIAKNHPGATVQMPWNYVNIAQGQFDKNGDTYKFVNGSDEFYKLTVEPVCVDNIYKISLENGDKGSLGANGVYNLAQAQNDQYKFAVGSKQADEIVDITKANLTNKFDHYSTGSIEAYITNVVSKTLTEYNNKIDEDKTNGTLDILRKVFATGSVDEKKSDLSWKFEGTTDFYIYLANDKTAGDLPVFEYGHYDLIAWDNIAGYDEKNNYLSSEDYAYITNKYKEDFHKSELEETSGLTIKDLFSKKWQYAEMNNEMVLKAHFYRKNYLLDLNTLKEETTNEGRYGYILIEITEEDTSINGSPDDMGGKFVAVFKDDKMQYFDVTNGFENINSIVGKTVYDHTTQLKHSKDLIVYLNSQCFIKLYAGCTLNITSSCVDYFNGDDLTYVDMVGYYLSSVKTTTTINGSLNNSKSWFNDVAYNNVVDKTSGKHNIELASSAIESKGCPSGSKIAINAYFAPIDYKITITLKTNGAPNPFAGRVDYNNKTTLSQIGGETIVIEGVNLDSVSYMIKYLANAGYTLSGSAIISHNDKNNGTHILLEYDNTKNTSAENSQEYLFVLDGKWLIENYYTDTYDARTNNQQTLALDVNTQLYKFDYNIEIVDELGNLLEVRKYEKVIELFGDPEHKTNKIASITLSDEKYTKLSKELIGNEFELLLGTGDQEDFYVIKILTCSNADAGHTHSAECYKNYVVLESWLPYTTLGNNNYKTIYEFLLKSEHLTKGTENDVLTQDVVNKIFRFGTIVNVGEDRTLTLRIKVSELYTITLKADKHTMPDPNYENRTTTIKNHDIGFGNYTNSATLTTSDINASNSVVIYSYKGVENVLSSTFNEIAYSGVVYRLGGSASNLESNVFTLDSTKVDQNGNIEVFVTYIPKSITSFNITYRLNGVENSSIVAKYGQDSTGKIIKETFARNAISLYFGQYINYGYELLKEDYAVKVTLNGIPQSNNPFACSVNWSAYQSGGFYIIVDVISIERENATIMFVLDDDQKAFADDVYGELDLFVNGSIATDVTMMGNMYVVKVAEGKKLEVDISKMAKGYSFVSLNRASTVLTTKLLNGKKLVITNKFSFEENNTYFVVIKKDTIKATLILEDDVIYKDNYLVSSPGLSMVVGENTKSVLAYLGKTLHFAKVDKDKEKLNYYYYVDKFGVEHKIEEDLQGELTLRLTTEILNQLEDKDGNIYSINIGVKTIKKYKLNYNVVNEIYAESIAVTVDDDAYLKGTYMLDGTTLNLSVVAKDNSTEAKYNIQLSGCINKTVTTGVVDEVIVLNADKELTITITPKNYASSNKEYIYKNINSYNSLTPELSAENIGGFNIVGSVEYNNTVTAKFNRVNAGIGELSVVRLSGNDGKDLIVHIKDKQITSVFNDSDDVEYLTNEDNAKHSGVQGVVLEQVGNLKDKLQEFGYNLSFNTTYGDFVEITFVVKNVIDIKTEYLCYLTITPVI